MRGRTNRQSARADIHGKRRFERDVCRAVKRDQPFVRLEIGFQVHKVHVLVAMGQERVTQWLEHAPVNRG